MTNKLPAVVSIIAIVLSAWALLVGPIGLKTNGATSFGATTAGNLLAENYIPYILYNGGYNSAKDINTSAFLGTTGTFLVGSSGTTLARINKGFCNIQANANTITASSTKQVDCVAVAGTAPGTALPGVTAGDVCWVGQSTTTSSISNGLVVNGASASSTQGFITLILNNLTGATFTWTAAASSSLPYLCMN